MQTLPTRNAALMALIASYYIQVGAGIFALAIIGRTIIAAPPRSLAMLTGPYAYNSGPFWQIVPPITGMLFLWSIALHWRTERRTLLLAVFGVFVISGVVTAVVLQPQFAVLAAVGYTDTVDPEMQRHAASWYRWDWAVRVADAVAGVALLAALLRSPATRSQGLAATP